MKKSMVIALAMAAISTAACGQKKESEIAPKAVEASFQKKFPNAQKVKWEKENDSEWEAEFKLDGKEYSANFSADGTWKETEHEIAKSEIPAAVQNALNTEFAGYKIEESEISETAEGTVYEFELEKGESDLEVTVDANGKILKKEVEEEHEEKD
ncbi:MAG: PepSY-like domain-containing protein [Flavobacteriales bacterium]|jgi:predicted small lipoprotein YifL|nr:PepSY-like domain-containing protein [Flavobacteriales bacterium]